MPDRSAMQEHLGRVHGVRIGDGELLPGGRLAHGRRYGEVHVRMPHIGRLLEQVATAGTAESP